MLRLVSPQVRLTLAFAAVLALAAFASLLSPAAAAQPHAIRSAEPPLAQSSRAAGFELLDPIQTGLRFTNRISETLIVKNRLTEDGAGVAAGDINGDGWCDLYFCRTQGPNALFINRGGWRFEEIAERAGVALPAHLSTGAALADIDGDDDLDLLIAGLGEGVRLFLNDAHGKFEESLDGGLIRRFGARSLALADIDGDGDLDLYVTHYRTTTVKDEPIKIRVTQRGSKPEVPPEWRERFIAETTPDGQVALIELGEPDILYLNRGHGRFEPAAWTQGRFRDSQGRTLAEPPRDWGLAAMFYDLNDDGAPDLYVCNDFYSPDRLWLNDGAGNFQALVPHAQRKACWASMAVDFADINRDGWTDFFAADMLAPDRIRRHTQRANLETSAVPAMGWGWSPGSIDTVTQVMRNTLFLNQGDQTFAEIGYLAGVHASDWTWGAAFMDVDLDGFEDLLIANGHSRDHLNSDGHRAAGAETDRARFLSHFKPLLAKNRAYRNTGSLVFEDRSGAWGFAHETISNGMALADLDNDGDLDVALNNFDAPAMLLRNDATAARVAVRLRGSPPNTRGIGARIRVLGGPVPQSQQIISAGRYLSCDDTPRVFAADRADTLRIEVTWRSGRRSVAPAVPRNSLCEIREDASP